MKKYLFLFVAGGLSGGVAAQEVEGGMLRDVVVTARPVKEQALTRTVIDSVRMAESATDSFAELLAKHSSIFVKTYGQGSTATVSFRGTAASHTQVLWNGVNINNPMLGQVDFSLIPVWFVDQTELYHGGSSLQDGSGALGGEVSLSSRPRRGEKLYASLMQTAGSYGTYQTFFSVGGDTGKFQARLRYMYDMAENDFEYLNRAIPPFEVVKQTNADYKKHGGVLDLYYDAGRNNYLSVNAWFTHADRNLPTIMSYQGLGRTEKQTDNDLRVVGRWDKFWEKFRSNFTSGFTTGNIDYYLANETELGPFVSYDSRSVIYSFYNKYTLEYHPSSRLSVKAMFNGNYHAVNIFDRITEEGYSAERTEFGASLSAHYRFTDWFSGYALLREDLTDDDFSPLMPSVGAEFRPFSREKLYVKLNGTRNYHQPTLNDLYWLPGGNPDLRPEEGYTTDLSVDYSRSLGRFTFSGTLTGYLSWIDDWIMWRPSEFRYWTAENVKKVFSRGTEIELSLGYVHQGLSLNLSGNYAYTRTTNEDPTLEDDQSRGRQLIYIPVHKGNVMLDGAYRGFYLYYVWSAVSERYTTSSNESTRHTLPAYDIHNMTVGKRFTWKNGCAVEVAAKINNVFDRKYQAILWRAMPGRNYLFSVKISYK